MICHAVKSMIKPFIILVAEFISYQTEVQKIVILAYKKCSHHLHEYIGFNHEMPQLLHILSNHMQPCVFYTMLLHQKLGTKLRRAPTRFFLYFTQEIVALVQSAPEVGPQILTVKCSPCAKAKVQCEK